MYVGISMSNPPRAYYPISTIRPLPNAIRTYARTISYYLNVAVGKGMYGDPPPWAELFGGVIGFRIDRHRRES